MHMAFTPQLHYSGKELGLGLTFFPQFHIPLNAFYVLYYYFKQSVLRYNLALLSTEQNKFSC